MSSIPAQPATSAAPAAPTAPATAATVARRAGVSRTAVSFALNGCAERHGIAKETIERILQAAREVNYVPNSLARSLRRQSSRAIGVLFPHLRNDWAHHMMEGMYDLLDAQEYVPHIASHRGSKEKEQRELLSLVERRVDGILCNPLIDSADQYRQVMERGIPLVFFGDTLNELPEVSFAAWDPAEVKISVRHLIEIGCRRIAYLGFVDNRRMTMARYQAFEQALQDHGVEVRREWIVLNREGESFEPALRRMFARAVRPDAVFALYDDTAMSAIDALNGMGLRVPDDVCVATLGDSPLIGPRGYNITSTTAPVEREGLEAARALLHLIEMPGSGPIQTLVPGGELVRRATTARTNSPITGSRESLGEPAPAPAAPPPPASPRRTSRSQKKAR